MLSGNNELATWVYALHSCLIEDGYDADAIMHAANFDFASISSSSEAIPRDSVAPIWDVVQYVTGEEAYWLKILPYVNDPYLNTLITGIQASRSIQEALQLLLRYHRVIHPVLRISANITDSLTIEINSSQSDNPIRIQDVDLTFLLIDKYATLLMPTSMKPKEIRLTRSKPKDLRLYQQHFKCPVFFETERNQICFPKEVLDTLIPSANQPLSNHVEQYLESQIETSNQQEISRLVTNVIIDLLPRGTPKLKDISIRLNLSERTLQRKLKQHDICYSSLLDETRLSLATQYLQTNYHSVQDIAFQLGFSEPGNFIRFFKKHTGKTPNAFVK